MTRTNARLLVGILAALVITLVVGIASTAEQAQAATSGLVKGPGVAVNLGGSTSWLGAYRDPKTGALVWCEDILLAPGDGTFRPGPHPARYDTETRARLATLINLYGVNVSDNRAAMRVKLAQDTLIAPWDATLRRWMPTLLAKATASDKTLITAMVTRSAVHAPYTAKATLDGATPGQPGRITVKVTGSNGKAASDLRVAYTLTGGKVTGGAAKTDANGTATAAFTATGLGQTVTATITAPSATRVLSNVPTAGHQMMIGGGYTETVRASDAAELCPVTATLTKTCPCKGNGTHTYRYTFTADPIPGDYVVWLDVDGAAMDSADLAPGASKTLTATLKPGQTVKAMYSIVDASGRSLWTDVLDTETTR